VAQALSRSSDSFDKWGYDGASKDTVKRARLYFEAEHWEGSTVKDTFRAYFVDQRLLQAITDEPVQRFATYFLQTFDGTMTPEYLAGMSEGDRLLKFKTSLGNKERGGIYQKVRRKHGFD
jgi:hypothetical protein